MNGYLADTNIPSELARPNPDLRVEAFLKQARREKVFLSVLTLGEMRKGVAALPQSRRRKDLDDWIETSMRPRFARQPITDHGRNRGTLGIVGR